MNWSLWKYAAQHLPNFILIGMLAFAGIVAYGKLTSWMNLQKFIAKQEMDQQELMNRRYLQLAANIARSQTEMVSEQQMRKIIDELVSPKIQELVRKNNETVIGVGNIVATLEKTAVRDAKADKETKFRHIIRDEDGNPVLDREGNLQYTDAKGIFIKIRVNEGSDNPGPNSAWVYLQNYSGEPWPEKLVIRKGTFQMNFEVKTTLTEQKSGRGYNNYTEVNLKSGWPKDPYYVKTYPIRIDTALHYFVKRNDRRFWWPAFHVDVGVLPFYGLTSTSSDFFPELGVSLAGYGRTTNDLDWKFLRMSLGYNKNAGVGLAVFPVGYNIGKGFGLFGLSDLWMAPGFGGLIGKRTSGYIGLSLGTTL